MVTVTASFSTLKFQISPPRVITEGDQLHIWCTIQVTHLAHETPEILIQKDKATVAHSRHSREAVYSVMATVEDNGNYTCKVESSRLSKVSSVVVNITELFLKPVLEFSSTRVDQGEKLDLLCSIPGAPPANFTIEKEGMIVSQGQITKITDCEVLSIKVIAPVYQVKLTILRSAEVESGKEIVLQCSMNEGTGPITYKFYKDKDSKPFHQAILNDTRVIWYKAQASKEQEGQYYCMASNKASVTQSSTQSNMLTVKVFLAPWKKGLIAVVIIGMIIATLVVGAKCYVMRKAKAKQMPMEVSRPAAPLLKSNDEKVSEPNIEANSHCGYSDEVGNRAMKPLNESKDSTNSDVEYTEMEVASVEPHQENRSLP
ncbi:Platelet endothelial cell adhesion molecule [Heterocephalus glaber]|uniref:Platelet endothelial cell adhesion molecule n=1 Tax=Heterocephalus glaber TaxID=10181 RepID=G5AZE1_HETGA|nr:Platelet endothelial cell adhesion molecule [Heterocephalus glaber]